MYGIGEQTMRLIDADELIKRIGKWIPKDPCGKEQTIEEVVATDIAISVCMEIEETSTAFDKEKVIEELKANMSSAQGISGQAVTFMFSDGYYNGTKDAIEIVEKGGIE